MFFGPLSGGPELQKTPKLQGGLHVIVFKLFGTPPPPTPPTHPPTPADLRKIERP